MRLQDLEGLIGVDEGELLAEYASHVQPPAVIVEVGSYMGKSACYLASRSLVDVYAVDAWDLPGNTPGRFRFDQARERFDQQVAAMGLQDRVTAVRGFSMYVAADWGLPVGLLHVDGDHQYRSVLADLSAWWPHLISGGTVICDDYGTERNPGVKQALDRFAVPYQVVGRQAILSKP